MVARTRFVKYDIRQMIERIDPNNRKRQTLSYEWSNGKKFYKNELPSASTGGIIPLIPRIDPVLPDQAFIVIGEQPFITSDGRDFRVINL